MSSGIIILVYRRNKLYDRYQDIEEPKVLHRISAINKIVIAFHYNVDINFTCPPTQLMADATITQTDIRKARW